MADLSPILGADVVADLAAADDMVARNPGGALDLAWPAFERAVFRLAGVALSHCYTAGRPAAAELKLTGPDGGPKRHLAIGDAVGVLAFCAKHAPLLPVQKLVLPAVVRLRSTIEHVLTAIKDLPSERLRSTRLSLVALVAEGATPSQNDVSLTAAINEIFVRLRNLEAHHAGRPQEWVSGHPDYAAAFAPLVIPAMLNLLGHPEIAAPLRGWRVATVTDISRPRGGKPLLIALTPDDAEIQKAYATNPPPGLNAGDRVVIDTSSGATNARVVMAFLDVSGGVPAALRGLEP